MHNDQAIQTAIDEVAALLDGSEVAMFTTRNREGRLVSRPLAARKASFDGSVWFLTALDSEKIGEIEADPRVNLAYVNAGNGAYVSIDGIAHVSVDRAQIAALWSEVFDKLFFPAGKDDPNIAALRVEANTVEAWTSASSAVGRAFDFVKARLTGDVAALGKQEHFDLHTGLRSSTSR